MEDEGQGGCLNVNAASLLQTSLQDEEQGRIAKGLTTASAPSHDAQSAIPLRSVLDETCDEYPSYPCLGMQGEYCNKTLPDTCPEGQQAMSVGSMTHDICCRWCSQGAFCKDDAERFSGTADWGSLFCGYEWRKALRAVANSRFWCVPQTPVNDLDESGLIKEYEVPNRWGNFAERKSATFLNSMVDYCAPSGTTLDCYDCDESCDGTSCPPEEAKLGDSEFCCSGRFGQVEVRGGLFRNKKWGICA